MICGEQCLVSAYGLDEMLQSVQDSIFGGMRIYRGFECLVYWLAVFRTTSAKTVVGAGTVICPAEASSSPSRDATAPRKGHLHGRRRGGRCPRCLRCRDFEQTRQAPCNSY